MTTHAAYDVYFDKLCDLLINGDKFDADVLEENDFTKRIIDITLYLKGVRPSRVTSSGTPPNARFFSNCLPREMR
jgi:hypothetical protein